MVRQWLHNKREVEGVCSGAEDVARIGVGKNETEGDIGVE